MASGGILCMRNDQVHAAFNRGACQRGPQLGILPHVSTTTCTCPSPSRTPLEAIVGLIPAFSLVKVRLGVGFVFGVPQGPCWLNACNSTLVTSMIGDDRQDASSQQGPYQRMSLGLVEEVTHARVFEYLTRASDHGLFASTGARCATLRISAICRPQYLTQPHLKI